MASTSAAARFAKTELEGHEQRKVELGAQRDAASASCAAAAAEEQKLRVTDEQLAKADDKLQRSQRCVDALAGTTANFEELERHISDAERVPKFPSRGQRFCCCCCCDGEESSKTTVGVFKRREREIRDPGGMISV